VGDLLGVVGCGLGGRGEKEMGGVGWCWVSFWGVLRLGGGGGGLDGVGEEGGGEEADT